MCKAPEQAVSQLSNSLPTACHSGFTVIERVRVTGVKRPGKMLQLGEAFRVYKELLVRVSCKGTVVSRHM